MAFEIITIPYGKVEPRNAYIVISDDAGVIVDPGDKNAAQMILDTLEQRSLDKDMFNIIILQSAHCTNTSGLFRLSEAGLKATVIVNTKLIETFIGLNVKTLDELDSELQINGTLSLAFHPTPFLPFPDTFTTYLIQKKILFSSHLFSQIKTDSNGQNTLVDALIYYHETTMPSSDFLRPAIRDLKHLNIESVYPLKGHAIQNESLKHSLTQLYKLEFYNNHNVVTHKNKYNKYDYREILNHMLKRLESHYEKAQIFKVFRNSEINLEDTLSVEIGSTNLKGYKLWNSFFEQIYKRKGIDWLIMLEPLVKKYSNLYNIKKPTIYKSELMKRQKALSKVHEEKTELKETVERLNEQLSKTSEQLLRDSLTSLYNERFFIQHLANEIEDNDLENDNLGLLLIRVDRFRSLNRQYGTNAGDETIKNLLYIIERVKPENAVLFRQKGPGFFLYFGSTTTKTMDEVAKTIASAVNDSQLFVKPISVSIYIATTDDLDKAQSGNNLAHTLINESRLNLERAQSEDTNLILNAKTAESTYKEGYILVVDEDETMQNLLVLIFKRLHYEVIITKDIYEAYEVVKTTPIDTIISEINLSKLDGLQFKRWLNESHTYQSIPFIIASHHKNSEIIKRCNLLNVDFVLEKPIITEELIGLVHRLKKGSPSL